MSDELAAILDDLRGVVEYRWTVRAMSREADAVTVVISEYGV